ncbi:MAG: ATP-binding cassette domain-containing protein, partial [Pseudomonadota bacterium]
AGALAGLGLAVQPLRDLAGAWGRRRRYLAARARCAALMALSPLPPVRRKRGGAAKPTALAFDGVREGVLRGLDAAIAPGGRVAVAGPNGAGKTLLLALAAGLEVPERGRVRLDGRPAHRPGPATARPCLIGAHSPILAGTLRRALTMGAASRPGLDDAAIEAAARRYGMDPVLRRLGGLDGCLGEGGRTLSTGERQRLLLARAALSGTGLMLLDKPDEGLDDAAPRLIAMLLAETSATVVMVTHRADVAALADTQWHLERGKLRTPCPAS